MAEPITIVDADGRAIEIRTLDPADTLDMLEAAGDASSNPGYVRFAMSIFAAASIGGVPVPLPKNKAAIKAAAKRLGNTGLAAVYKHLFGALDDTDAEDTPKPAPDADVLATAKN